MKGENLNQFCSPTKKLIIDHICNLGFTQANAREFAEMLVGERMAREVENSFAGNTLVEYPSRKMGLLIQCESLSVEYARVLELEFDPDVLWYSTQPASLAAPRIDKDGNEITHRFTPDLLVVTTRGIHFEEGKPEAILAEKVRKGSTIYCRGETGYRHLPGERNTYGVPFRVFTENDVSRIAVANFEFLHGHHWDGEPCPDDDLEWIEGLLFEHRELTIKQLTEDFGVPLRSVHAGMAYSQLNWLPSHDRIVETDRCRVFATSAYAVSALQAKRTKGICLPIGSKVRFLNAEWTLMGFDSDSLQLALDGKVQKVFIDQLPAETQKYLQDNSIPARSIASIYDHKMVETAQKRMIALNVWETTGELPSWENGTHLSIRTLQSWRRQRDVGIASGETELEALMPALDRQGARPKAIPSEIEEFARMKIRTLYLNKLARNLKSVLKEVNREISNKWNPSLQISESTFRRYAKDLDVFSSTWKRHGKRRANQVRPSHNVVSGQPKQGGDFPFHVVEFDHTEADIRILDNNGTPKNVRLAFTVALDSYSRYPLCWLLTEVEKKGVAKPVPKSVDPNAGKENTPSNRRAAQLIQLLVCSYRTLPTRIHTDGGSDFEGKVLLRFLTSERVIKTKRPPGDPKKGPTIERFFKAVNEGLLHNLPGNTQDLAPKMARMNSKSHRPDGHAELTMQDLRDGM